MYYRNIGIFHVLPNFANDFLAKKAKWVWNENHYIWFEKFKCKIFNAAVFDFLEFFIDSVLKS